jgi:hypothetical protein
MIDGYYKNIVGVGELTLGVTDSDKTYVQGMIEFASGEQLPWRGWFTEKAAPSTIKQLQLLGCTFENNDMTDFSGYGTLKADCTVETQEYNGRETQRVAFINDPRKSLDDDAKKAFGDRFKAALMKAKKDFVRPDDAKFGVEKKENEYTDGENDIPF